MDGSLSDLIEHLKAFFEEESFDAPVRDELITLLSVASKMETEKAIEQVPTSCISNGLLLFYKMNRVSLLEQLLGSMMRILGPKKILEVVNKGLFLDKEMIFNSIREKIRKGGSFISIYPEYAQLKDDVLERLVEGFFDKESLDKEIEEAQVNLARIRMRKVEPELYVSSFGELISGVREALDSNVPNPPIARISEDIDFI